MSEPFLSELRIFSFNFAPRGWALCNGQLLPINQNAALFSLLGTTYGGDGRQTFGLPNLQGCVAVHTGPFFNLGQSGGEQAHTLSAQELGSHTHLLAVQSSSTAGSDTDTPGSTVVLTQAFGENQQRQTVPYNIYAASSAGDLALNAASLTASGGAQAHNNLQPYLTLTVCIALSGIFPTQN